MKTYFMGVVVIVAIKIEDFIIFDDTNLRILALFEILYDSFNNRRFPRRRSTRYDQKRHIFTKFILISLLFKYEKNNVKNMDLNNVKKWIYEIDGFITHMFIYLLSLTVLDHPD